MKWTYIVQQKAKVALLLTCIVLLIIVSSLISRKNVKDMNKSFASIYHDRLIPATDIFYLTENLYSKRALMEKFLFAEDGSTLASMEQLKNHNRHIDSLISAFEKTYLIDKESQSLREFKKRVGDYTYIENKILDLFRQGSKEQGRKLYETKGKPLIQDLIKHLYELIEIQSFVGKELMNESQNIEYSNNLLSTLQITLAIFIGAITQALVLSSKVLPRSDKNFTLN